MINGKLEEKKIDDGPSLERIFEDDTDLHDLSSQLQVRWTSVYGNLQ